MIYKSNLTAPDLQPKFTHTEEHLGTYGHTILHDKDFEPHCGYMSHDEAAILHNITLLNKGEWLEIGGHTGWSGAHIASAKVFVDILDPSYKVPAFIRRAADNLEAAELLGYCRLIDLPSEKYWGSKVHGKRKYEGVVVDGNHDAPYPQKDAEMLLPWLTEDAVVFFHDFCGKPIRDGVKFLISQGFNFRVYNTPQLVGVCYRGNITLPEHVPDPSVDWRKRRAQYTDFDYTREQ